VNTLVLLHGWGATGRVWARQADYFQGRVTVLTPTIPAWEVGWFSEYLRGLPLPTCLLVGWSLGGMLLMEALSGQPGLRPGGLVLAGVAPVFTRRPAHPWGQPPAVVRAMRRALQENRRRVLEDFADRCLAPGEAAFGSQTRAALASPASTATLAAGLDYLLQADLRPLLSGSPRGTVIIQGQEDGIVDPAQARFLQGRLPGARLHQLPEAGHLPFLTQAAAFNRILEECLAEGLNHHGQ
jgi:pimeloyl-[acyl-carrier protein] methyl ester esterase